MTSTRSRVPRNPNSWGGGNVPMPQNYSQIRQLPPQALMHNPANFTGQQQRGPLLQQPGLQPHMLPVMPHIPLGQQIPPTNYRGFQPAQQVPVFGNPAGSLIAGQQQSMPGMGPSFFPHRQHIYIPQQVRGTPRQPYIKPPVYPPVSHQVPEKRSKAVAIVDPTTKEQLDVSQIKGGGSGNISTTSEKLTDPNEEAKERFKKEVHDIVGTPSTSTSSTEPRPNAIISNPNIDTNTDVSVITTIETTQRITSDKTNDTKLTEETPPTTDLSETDTQGTHPDTSGKSQPETQSSDLPSTEIKSQTPPIEVTPSTQGDTTSEVVTTGHDMNRQPHVVVSQTETKPLQPSPEPVTLSTGSPNSHPIDPLPVEPSKESSIETLKSDTLAKELPDTTIEQNTQVSIEEKQPDSLASSTMETDKLSDLEDETTGKQAKPDTSPDLDRSSDIKDSEMTSLTSSEPFQESDTDMIEEVAMETGEEEEEEEKVEEEEMIVNGDVHVEESIGFSKDPQGRFRYERDFLLQFKDKNIEPPKQLSQYSDVYRPQSSNNTTGPRRDGRNVRPTRKIDYNPSKEEKVELRKAENRWTRSEKMSGDVSVSEETEEVFRKFQGILNKLTPQKFKDLAERARELNINTEERLRGCIDKIFSKALEEPNFSVAYAHLCRVLSYIKVEIVKTDESGEETKKETSFRRELLTRCQKEFEKDKKDDETREEKKKAIEEATSEEEKKLKKEQLTEWEDISRKRSLGNIRFIGELFKLKMLSESIMHECIVRLLRSTSDEEALECFGRLITTTGKELDHPQAKQRMDRYFERIADIIEKKKISSRIRFMLQDVQEMRKNEWVARRQETLKTIDQIHMEAEMEAIQEKEMIRSLQPMSSKQFTKEEKRRGNKSGQDDYSSRKGEKTGGRRDSTPDVTRITALSNRKEKEKSTTTLGPGGLRPGGWKRSQAPTPPPSDSKTEKERAPQPKGGQQRSSSSGKRQAPPPGGRNSQQGVRRSSTQPDERAELLKTVKDFAQPAVTSQPKKPVDKLDEATIERKTPTIVDELVQNKDFKEAVECVSEMESPSLLHVFVREAINRSLEKTSQTRVLVGTLFSVLLKDNLLPEERLTIGLQEVLEIVDDLEVDIPKIWDFFAEIVAPALSDALSLDTFAKLLKDANLGNRAAKSMARTLKQCAQTTSKEKILSTWQASNLEWTDLGLQEKDIEEFLQRENLSFLLDSSSSNPLPVGPGVPPDDPPYLKDLTVMFGSRDCTNDDILDWIEKTIANEERKSAQFIKTLTRAAVKGSTSGGEGNQCIYEEKTFENRLNILKKYADENVKLQIEVLNGVQVGVALLKHPPNILHKMFQALYDVEVVSEQACFEWKEKGSENYGRGVALMSAKNFLSWLETAETESDSENYS